MPWGVTSSAMDFTSKFDHLCMALSGSEQVYPLPYCNFSAGCEVRHGIWMHWTLILPKEHQYALGYHQFSHGFYIRIAPSRLPLDRYIHCRIAISVPDVRSGT